ncbi:hypothetical protein HYU12_03600 [Candidatus Woesearchaeota archaeon]|nr:hypothetical protein [Candidatus Woesearchaeota archaeon]
MASLLYVCRYNLDRSPVAEQITRIMAADASLNVSSAGLTNPDYNHFLNVTYLGMTNEIREAMKRLGYVPSMHQNSIVTEELLKLQDLILCMERKQVDNVLEKAPDLEGRVFTLPQYAGFLYEEVASPASLIGSVPLFFIFRDMPYEARAFIYRLCRKTDPRDYEGVIRCHMHVIKKIEFYVDNALKRMRKEGLILA